LKAVIAGAARSSNPDPILQLLIGFVSDPLHIFELLRVGKASVFLPVCDDETGCRLPDPGKRIQLLKARRIDVDPAVLAFFLLRALPAGLRPHNTPPDPKTTWIAEPPSSHGPVLIRISSRLKPRSATGICATSAEARRDITILKRK